MIRMMVKSFPQYYEVNVQTNLAKLHLTEVLLFLAALYSIYYHSTFSVYYIYIFSIDSSLMPLFSTLR